MTERTEVQTTGTIDTSTPLTVTVDGATVSCPAYALDSASYLAGQRVTVIVRNPRPPLVQGVES